MSNYSEYVNQVPGKNVIINGDMVVSQRGTSFVSPGSGDYTIDRFRYWNAASTATHTISQDSDIPNDQFQYSMKIDCTATEGNVDYTFIGHRIEGHNFKKFVGQTATLSFWIKSSKTGTLCVAFRNNSGDRSYVVEVEIDSVDTWERKTVTLDFDYSGGSWNYTNGVGLQVCFNLLTGSGWQTSTTGSWLSGSYLGTANQTNFLDSTSNVMYLTGVQLELGSTATDYEFLDYGIQLQQCQRYYQTSYHYQLFSCHGDTYGSAQTVLFPVPMRTNPARSYNTDSQANTRSNYLSSLSTAPNSGFLSVLYGNQTNNVYWGYTWTADAEL